MQEVIQLAIVGNPSTGKSTSLRTLPPKETFIITPNIKTLPFRGASKNYSLASKSNPTGNRAFCDQLTDVKDRTGKVLDKGLISWIKYVNTKRPEIKYLVIEDITHFFNARTNSESFTQSKDWGKWGVFATDVFKALIDPTLYRTGLNVIHIWHAQTITHQGEQISTLRTQGKALNEKILPSSYYTYVLHSDVKDYDEEPNASDRYFFWTNNNGYVDAKTSMEMFPMQIKNDALAVFNRIHEYNNEEFN